MTKLPFITHSFAIYTDMFVITLDILFRTDLIYLQGCSASYVHNLGISFSKIKVLKGGLISKTFSLWLEYPKKCAGNYPEHYPAKEKMPRIVICHNLGDLSQIEKIF